MLELAEDNCSKANMRVLKLKLTIFSSHKNLSAADCLYFVSHEFFRQYTAPAAIFVDCADKPWLYKLHSWRVQASETKRPIWCCQVGLAHYGTPAGEHDSSIWSHFPHVLPRWGLWWILQVLGDKWDYVNVCCLIKYKRACLRSTELTVMWQGCFPSFEPSKGTNLQWTITSVMMFKI